MRFSLLYLISFARAFTSIKTNELVNKRHMRFYANLPSQQLSTISQKNPWSYSELIENIKKSNIDTVTIYQNKEKYGVISLDKFHDENIANPENFHLTTIFPDLLKPLVNMLEQKHIYFDMYEVPERFNALNVILSPIGFVGLYLTFIILNRIRMSMGGIDPGGQNNPFNFLSKDTVNVVDKSSINTTFADVAGCDEAKFELTEIVDFLKNPQKYEEAGAKIPRGILLDGNPGTGKTLMAKAVAGEADVPFISVSGSEFIEVYVGVGASRVRKLFDKARENAPCVIFIDEIDAIGRQRGAGINSGNDEREQTLNQILTNMDGFNAADGIIVIGATNRADILDSALLRPGRFDRKVTVPLPDNVGRKAIANVHFRNKNIDQDVNLDEVADLTEGFSGADIANIANEAAILSVRNNLTKITRTNIIDAYEKMTIGLPNTNERRAYETLKLVSYHEIGHALLALLFPTFFNVRTVTIRSTQNGAGGYTLFTPKEPYASYPSKSFILANIVVSLGGRAAEVLLYENNSTYSDIFHEIKDLSITTGASNDLKQANSIARRYISKYGLGNSIGTYEPSQLVTNPFVGRNMGTSGGYDISDATKEEIDLEVNSLVTYSYEKALSLLRKNKKIFHALSHELLKENTLDGNYLNSRMSNTTSKAFNI